MFTTRENDSQEWWHCLFIFIPVRKYTRSRDLYVYLHEDKQIFTNGPAIVGDHVSILMSGQWNHLHILGYYSVNTLKVLLVLYGPSTSTYVRWLHKKSVHLSMGYK